MSEPLALDRGSVSARTNADGDTPAAGSAPMASSRDTGFLRVFVFALFFFFGGITSLTQILGRGIL